MKILFLALTAIALLAVASLSAGQAGAAGEPVEQNHPESELLVLNLGWDTGQSNTSSPLVESNLPLYVNELNSRVRSWFKEASRGAFQGYQAVPGGSFTIPAPNIGPAGCDANREAILDEIRASADAAARARGLEPNSYRGIVYVWNRRVCSFSGIGDSIGGRRIYLQTPFAAVHEIGHILGLPHANLLECTEPSGIHVPLSNNCRPNEYGDVYDTMGLSGAGLFNVVFQNALGWLKGQFVSLSSGDYSQTVTLQPLSGPNQGMRAIRLADGPVLWIEYRQATGLDKPNEPDGLTRGVLIHREVSAPPGGGLTGSLLLDMSAEASSFDSTLPVGQTWVNPLGEMKVTVNSETPTGATVTISNRNPKVSVPALVGDSEEGAIERVHAVGLTPSVALVPDPTCESVGAVISQSPGPGARLAPGASVLIRVGRHSAKCF